MLRGERADVTDFFLMALMDTSVVKHNMLTLYYTVSGIITPIGGRPVHRLREDSSEESSLNLCTGRPPIDVMILETV